MHYVLFCNTKLIGVIYTKDICTKNRCNIVVPKRYGNLKSLCNFSLRIADKSMVCDFRCYYTTFEVS